MVRKPRLGQRISEKNSKSKECVERVVVIDDVIFTVSSVILDPQAEPK